MRRSSGSAVFLGKMQIVTRIWYSSYRCSHDGKGLKAMRHNKIAPRYFAGGKVWDGLQECLKEKRTRVRKLGKPRLGKCDC